MTNEPPLPRKVLARGSLYNSYAIAALYGAWTLVIVGFQVGVLTDTPAPQRAAFVSVVTYVTTISVFGFSTALLAVARTFYWRYVAAFAASVPPLYQLVIYVGYPLTSETLPVNFLGLVLWLWLMLMVVLLVHWEHERLEWIAVGAGDPILVIERDPQPVEQPPHLPRHQLKDDAL